MYKIIFLVLLLIVFSYIIYVRYDPFYVMMNKKRDPENFRYRVFFEEGFWDKIKKLPSEEPFEIVKKINTHIDSDNIISYSLYGNNPKYYKYLDENIQYVNKFLPDWVIRIYLHDKVDQKLVKELEKKNIQIYIVHDNLVVPGNSAGAFWRFLPLCEDKNVIIKDIDDNFDESNNYRIVNNFFTNSDKKIKYASGFPWPFNHIQAKNIYKKKEYKIPLKEEEIINYFHRSTFGSDEIFLSKILYYRLDKDYIENNFRISKLFSMKEY